MKKTILILFTLIAYAICANAQNFYSPDDITIKWVQGDLKSMGFDKDTDDIQYIVPIATPYNSQAGASVLLSFMKDNKFLCIECVKHMGSDYKPHNEIIMHYSNSWKYLSQVFPDIKEMLGYDWFNIDFENIFYHEKTNTIVIPCNYDMDMDKYWWSDGDIFILMGLGDNNAVKTIPSDNQNLNTVYYNIKGQRVKPSDVSDEIIIRKNAEKSEKILVK